MIKDHPAVGAVRIPMDPGSIEFYFTDKQPTLLLFPESKMDSCIYALTKVFSPKARGLL